MYDEKDVNDIGTSVFNLHHGVNEHEEGNRKDSKEELKDVKKLHTESKGLTENEFYKYLLRKDSKGVDKTKMDKKPCEGKADSELIKVPSQKDNRYKNKDEKDKKEIENEESQSEYCSQLSQEQLGTEEPKVPEHGTDRESLDSEMKNRFENTAESTSEITKDSVVSSHDNPQKSLSYEPKRQSRFRLKAQLNKLDAKFRKAFSSENSISFDTNSEFFVDEKATHLEPDVRMNENVPCAKLDDKSGITECSELVQEGDYTHGANDGNSLEAQCSVVHEEAKSNLKSSPSLTPKASPKLTPSSLEELKLPPEDVDYQEKVLEAGNKQRLSLTLFDKDGNPVPPPRRKFKLDEAKEKSIEIGLDCTDLGKDLGLLDTNPLEDSQSHECFVSSNNYPGVKDEAQTMYRKLTQRNQPSEITPAQTTAQSVSTPLLLSGGAAVTSPTNKGSFRSFVTHITKKSSTQISQGMFYWSPFNLR
ncbi:hypothetical protein SK128_011896 [Halocaridina rubra]|uniref:Uncharacterized protein n=1 Tax=Halocaridina rubra TaxID=373956 RepID=A0AAN8W8Y4_HALRR